MTLDDIKPEIGMGVTAIYYTDRLPFTIIKVYNDRRIDIQEDQAIRLDNNGMSDSQNYHYNPDPKGQILTITRRKDGKWAVMGDDGSGVWYKLGSRRRYHDYSY